MFCNKCGNEVSEGASFCKNCGNKLTNKKEYDLNKWIKILKIALIIFIISVIVTAITSQLEIDLIWQIARIITFIMIPIVLIPFIICTIISFKNKEKVPLWFTILQGIIIAFIIIFIISSIIEKNQNDKLQENIEKYKNENKTTYNSSYITLEEFNEIEIGMTYDQVVEIIGGKGDLAAEDAYSETYTWEPAPNSGIYSVTMSFYNGKLTNKLKF